MPTMSNTSPIFNLACIGRLKLLHEQFGDIWIPQAVRTELQKIPQLLKLAELAGYRVTFTLKRKPAA